MGSGFAREVAEGAGKIEINYISRWLCFRPPEFPTTKQISRKDCSTF